MSADQMNCPKSNTPCINTYCIDTQDLLDTDPSYVEEAANAFGMTVGSVLLSTGCVGMRANGLRELSSSGDESTVRNAGDAMILLAMVQDISEKDG